MEDLKEAWIDPLDHQVTKLDTSLYEFKEEELVALLRRNIDLFIWVPSDMQRKDTKVVCHLLTNNPPMKIISYRKHNMGEKKRESIDEEVQKLRSANFITELKYQCCLANIVLANTSNHYNYYYDVMPFGMKSADADYQNSCTWYSQRK